MRPLLIAASLAGLLALATAACDALPETARARSRPRAVATTSGPQTLPARTPGSVQPAGRRGVPVARKTPLLCGLRGRHGRRLRSLRTSTQLDSRFSQVLRESEGPHVLGKDAAAHDGLLTWLEISPTSRPCSRSAVGSLADGRRRGTALGAHHRRIGLQPACPVAAGGGRVDAVDAGRRRSLRDWGAEHERPPPYDCSMRACQRDADPVRMLADLTRRYGGIDIALAAWNAGEGNVRKAGGRMPGLRRARRARAHGARAVLGAAATQAAATRARRPGGRLRPGGLRLNRRRRIRRRRFRHLLC